MWQYGSLQRDEYIIIYTNSIDGGVRFIIPMNISSGSSDWFSKSFFPQVDASRNNVYIAWQETSIEEIRFPDEIRQFREIQMNKNIRKRPFINS